MLYEITQKIEEYKDGIVQQFNHINNTIPRADQDDETRRSVDKMAIMIDNTNKIIKFLNKID